MPSDGGASIAGGGMTTASSAARDGVTGERGNRERADGGGIEGQAAEWERLDMVSSC